ncbi:unnamed protein product [Soboliphyme baturini]|uniref:Transthyretin-like family protein n=1 Tax=Soboliphyme baturini TaxID=241478 RepID=A0A183IY07_9BILA|nr:unnamed protein product [Soboliphyme baturini]
MFDRQGGKLLLLFATRWLALQSALGNRECTALSGILVCHRNRSAAANVKLFLWDKDEGEFGYGFATDDQMMATNVTDANGSFTLIGCGYDKEAYPDADRNQPDPYIEIRHTCNGPTLQKTAWNLPKIFTPGSL